MLMMQTPPIAAPPGLDPNFVFNQVAPLIGVIAVFLVGAFTLKWLFRSPVGEALAERIRAGRHRRRHWKGFGGEWLDVPADGPADDRRVAALEEQVSLLNGQVAELAERLDFAERMLAERRERTLGAGQ